MPPVDLNTQPQWQTLKRMTGDIADRRFNDAASKANYHAGNHPGVSRAGQFMPVELFREVLKNLRFDPAIARLTQVSKATRFAVFAEAGDVFRDTHQFLAPSRDGVEANNAKQ